MFLLATAIAFIALGYELAARGWREESEVSPIERFCAAGVIGVVLWIASAWLLALPQAMTRGALLARTALVAAAAIVLFVRRPKTRRQFPAVALLFLIPLVLWVSFIAWRAWVVAPASHDALSYHLPKAVLFSRAHGYVPLREIEPVLRQLPVNYEMLLADVVTMEGSDRVTEWLDTLLYLLIVVTSGALAHRWWRHALATIATMSFVAGVPVLLLHSGADKNDLLTGLMALAMLVFAGRWFASGDFLALLVSGAALFAGLGTKPQIAVLGAALAPLVLWRAVVEWRGSRLRLRHVAAALAFTVVAAALLGCLHYLPMRDNASPAAAAQTAAATELPIVTYGDWANLWQGPYVLLAAPFSPSPVELRVPWSERPWFWRRYEIYFSENGIPFAICALAAPFVLLRLRKREPLAVFAASLAALVAMMPVYFVPHGLFPISLPRYSMFFPPVVFATVIGALTVWLDRTRGPRAATLVVLAGAVSFTGYAISMGFNDTFAPIEHVVWASRNPGNRAIAFADYRAASIADQLAAPRDTIAIEIAFGTWVQPVFGASLSRPVELIPLEPGPPRISDAADWVVVDRGWNVGWGHEKFQDLSDAHLLSRGRPRAEDMRIIEHLDRDPRFKRVYFHRLGNQAVYQRIR